MNQCCFIKRQIIKIYKFVMKYSESQTKASISLACEFLATVLQIESRTFHTTVVRLSHECRENIYKSQTSREGFKHVSKFYAIFSPTFVARLSCDSRTTFLRVSRTSRREMLANLQCEIFATLVRMSYDSRATVLRKHANTSRLSGEKIKLSDIPVR